MKKRRRKIKEQRSNLHVALRKQFNAAMARNAIYTSRREDGLDPRSEKIFVIDLFGWLRLAVGRG